MLTCEQIRPWLPSPRHTSLCAVSGGLDSMCLLHLLHAWHRGRGEAVAVHFNHQLRPSSDGDESFVRAWCEEQGIPFLAGRGDVRAFAAKEGLSLEEAARTMRYAFLRSEQERRVFARICTAHHLEDNAETILLNLVRGTGIRGLAGMAHRRGGIHRPLLDVRRAELEEYAAAHNIPHVEDESNADPDAAARNLVRLKLMPLLKELNPKAEEHMHAAAQQLAVIDGSLEDDARARTARAEVRDGRVVLSRQALYGAPAAVRPRMLLCALDKLGVGRKDFGAVHLDAVLGLCRDEGRRERRLDLPRGVTARYQRGWLTLETRPQPLTEVELVPNSPLRWGGYALTLREFPEGLPGDWRGTGLALRERKWRGDPRDPEGRLYEEGGVVTVAPCRPGERLTLPGAKGSRSVKRLCVDRHISLPERDGLPAIYADGQLAAVWRLGVDTAFAPEGAPCRFIQIKQEENGYEK